MCIGTKLRKLINFLTLGFGKSIAQKVANKLGFEDCGCSSREQWLNKRFGCNASIKLN
jgi:hypothetical protein